MVKSHFGSAEWNKVVAVFASRAKEIVERITYATLATVSVDGQPWNSPVYVAYDDQYNFYWGSYWDSQHSQNVRANGKGFLVIYDSTVEAGRGEGVYIQVHCMEVTDGGEIAFAHDLIQSRRRPVPYWTLDEVSAPLPIRIYKATPERSWMNDESRLNGHYIDTRTEVTLN